jgi:hypothetical protein
MQKLKDQIDQESSSEEEEEEESEEEQDSPKLVGQKTSKLETILEESLEETNQMSDKKETTKEEFGKMTDEQKRVEVMRLVRRHGEETKVQFGGNPISETQNEQIQKRLGK